MEFVRNGIYKNWICKKWNMWEMEYARNGICKKWNLWEMECVINGICEKWNG